jgi:hypothetical protein
VGSCDFPAKFEKQAVQILMLLLRGLMLVHAARRHVVDESMMLVGKPVFLVLHEGRDLGRASAIRTSSA